MVIAFIDDVRYFGTDPEVALYKEAVLSRLKVKFEKPPMLDFVSIETYQSLEEGTFELKMPKYFDKAKKFFRSSDQMDSKKEQYHSPSWMKNAVSPLQLPMKFRKRSIFHFFRR